jgi:DNA-binding MarR family transcriptional regulator
MITSMDKQEASHAILGAFRDISTQSIMMHQAVADLLGLNITDHKCLGLLHRYGSMSSGHLSKLTGLTTGAITGVVDRLEKAGYAKRKGDPNDRRAIIIEPKNQDTFEKKVRPIFGPLSRKSSELLASYDLKELKLILDFIGKFVNLTQGEIIRLRGRKK